MASIPANALYIGRDTRVNDLLKQIKTDWNFLNPVASIAELWSSLNNGTLTDDIQAIFILDTFFDETGVDTTFEDFIAQMGPFCYLGILSYRPHLQNLIIERISDASYKVGAEGNTSFYFIKRNDPVNSINKSLSQFIANATTPELVEVRNRILGQTQSVPNFAPAPTTQENFSYENQADEIEEPSEYLGNIIAVTSSKGGSGKSTVAITLSTLLAHSSINSVKEGLESRPLKVIIVDLDIRDGQLGFLTNYNRPTVLNLIVNEITDESLNDTIIHSPRLKVDLLLAPKKPRASEETPPDFYLELLQKLKKRYDYIILDTSVNYLDPLLENVAYPIANKIIFVTDIVINSVFSMTRWVQEVTSPKEKNGMGIDRRKIGIVVNKSLSDINMSGEKIAKGSMGLPLITAIPSNPKLIAHAANLQTMESILKHGDLYKSFLRLAKAIVGKSYRLSDNVL